MTATGLATIQNVGAPLFSENQKNITVTAKDIKKKG